MAEIIYALFLIGIGILSLFFSIKSLMNPAFAKKYVETSPKAWLWKKIFGTEKTSIINQKIFLPLGIILGLGFIIVGVLLFIL